jgi:hypothetical protein
MVDSDWDRYINKKLDLAAAAIATNMAFQLARHHEDEARIQLLKIVAHLDSQRQVSAQNMAKASKNKITEAQAGCRSQRDGNGLPHGGASLLHRLDRNVTLVLPGLIPPECLQQPPVGPRKEDMWTGGRTVRPAAGGYGMVVSSR